MHGAEIGERLQRRQYHAGGNGGPRQGSATPEKVRTGRGQDAAASKGVRLAEESVRAAR